MVTKEKILEKQDKVRTALELPELDVVNSDADVLMLLLKYNIQLKEQTERKRELYYVFTKRLYAPANAYVTVYEGLDRNWCVANAVLNVMINKLGLFKINFMRDGPEMNNYHTFTIKIEKSRF